MSNDYITIALNEQTHRLLDLRCSNGYWPGRLSSSALATAVAIRALLSVNPGGYTSLVETGRSWLKDTQLPNGSWGDTSRSTGNISTTLLCYSVIPDTDEYRICRNAAEGYISRHAGSLSGSDIRNCILARYGNDKTFSAPILALAAISGTLGDSASCWERVPQLPFELAALPRGLFHIMKMDVVSYAIPALIAIGLVCHVKKRRWFSPLRYVRDWLTPLLLTRLASMQPSNGGFLEAIPLTAFVTMSLAEAGYGDHPVVKKGVEFILASFRKDGSQPIDTNLETWLTSQSVKALGPEALSAADRSLLTVWYTEPLHLVTGLGVC